MQFSSLFSINKQERLKGLIVACISTTGTTLVPILKQGHLPTHAEFISALYMGLGAGGSYLLLKFCTGQPQTVVIDPCKTKVIDKTTNEVLTPKQEPECETNAAL